MKKYLLLSAGIILFFLNSCTNGSSQNSSTKLSAAAFADKINALPLSPVVDVRTPEEFSKGHLQHALNIDWNGDNFDQQLAALDKSKPVFVYCLSGGRSSSAANKMRSDGFKEVYELDGGIMKWRAANLPETTNPTVMANGMSKENFDLLIKNDKLVLIDFYADWCEPCKKMKPYLEEISKEMEEKVIVIRINVDDNQTICKALKIDALPELQLYKKSAVVWSNKGFADKAFVVKAIQSN